MNSIKLASILALLISQLSLVGQAVAQVSVKDYERAAIEKLNREKAEAARKEAEERAAAAARGRTKTKAQLPTRTIRDYEAAAQARIEAERLEAARQEELERLGRLCIAALAQETPGRLLSNCDKASRMGDRDTSIAYARYLYDTTSRSPEHKSDIIRYAILAIDRKRSDTSCDEPGFCFDSEHHFIADVLLEFRNEAKDVLIAMMPPPKDMDMDVYINAIAFRIYSRTLRNTDDLKPFSSAERMILHGLIPLQEPTIPAAIDFKRAGTDWSRGSIHAWQLNEDQGDEEPEYPSISDVDRKFFIRALAGTRSNFYGAEILACEAMNVASEVTETFAQKVCDNMSSGSIVKSSAVDSNGEPISSIVYFKVELLCATEANDWPSDGCEYKMAVASNRGARTN